MTNAVRHSGAATIDVLCRVAPPSAEIVVSDDGTGLGTGRDDSHGMEIMRERATLIGAQLEVHDRAPRGTTVAVRLFSNGVSAPEPTARPDTLTA
jgi:nitrate/nitrite-specific signal transduction histidine kinase